MFYTVYKITNTINGIFYIGIHQTENLDDNYMGSGFALKRAKNKFGIENFHKEYLHILNSKKLMILLERILVVPDSEISYNLARGGGGGWNKGIPMSKEGKSHLRMINLGKKHSDEVKIRMRNPRKTTRKKETQPRKKETKPRKRRTTRLIDYNKPKIIQDEMRKILLEANKSRCWITDGIQNKKIKKDVLDIWINMGYKRGRITNKDPIRKIFI